MLDAPASRNVMYVLPALLIFAMFAFRRLGNRPVRTGAHNLAATR